jgi:hypothetical protein
MPKRTRSPTPSASSAADCAFVQQAVEQLRSSDGWRRWLTTRRLLMSTRCLSGGACVNVVAVVRFGVDDMSPWMTSKAGSHIALP